MNIWSRGQVVKTPPFHGGIRGSSPLEITNRQCLFFLFCLIKVKRGLERAVTAKATVFAFARPGMIAAYQRRIIKRRSESPRDHQRKNCTFARF